jgi:hypothetical protein
MNHNIFFISFNESNQEKNWSRVLELHSDAIRLHGIKGISVVHLLANEISNTEYFWTVDGDNWLTKELVWNQDITVDLLMFNALDPITDQPTNLGGVKLWKKNSIINKDMSKGDFCLNATATKSVVAESFSYTNYNVSPYDSWKTSFRHCVKLLSSIFRSRPNASNIEKYLDHWKSCQHLDNGKNYASWAYQGFLDAEEFVNECSNDHEKLLSINDYYWLRNKFNIKYQKEK